MMCNIFSIWIFLNKVISDQLEDQTKEFNFISEVISALDNDEIMHYWFKNGTLKYEKAFDILKDIVSEVKEIISVIDNPDYEDLKNFVVDTEISFWDTFPFSYFKTCIITKYIGNILKLKDIYEKQGLESCQFEVKETYYFKDLDEIGYDYEAASQESGVNELFTKIVLIEYEYIYLDILQEICCIIRPYLYRYNFQFHENLFSNIKPFFNENYWKLACYFIKISRNIVKDILAVGKTGRTFIMASKKGITFSRKCFWDMSGNHLDGEYETLLPLEQIQDFEHDFSKYNGMIENVLKKYINRLFVCNYSTASFLVSLIHYYTVGSSVDTEYEIFLNEKGLYEIKWSYSKLPSVESIKNYYWKKDIPASFYPMKKVENVAFLKDYFVGHSIIKNNDENAKPIRLMVLSCGHQLGFELLDKFFDYDYGFRIRNTRCPMCRKAIEIIGSHDV